MKNHDTKRIGKSVRGATAKMREQAVRRQKRRQLSFMGVFAVLIALGLGVAVKIAIESGHPTTKPKYEEGIGKIL